MVYGLDIFLSIDKSAPSGGKGFYLTILWPTFHKTPKQRNNIGLFTPKATKNKVSERKLQMLPRSIFQLKITELSQGKCWKTH